jgi:hypothetical protein
MSDRVPEHLPPQVRERILERRRARAAELNPPAPPKAKTAAKPAKKKGRT